MRGGGGGGGRRRLSYEKDGAACCTFKGLKKQLYYLLECLASKGPQQELLRYWEKTMTDVFI